MKKNGLLCIFFVFLLLFVSCSPLTLGNQKGSVEVTIPAIQDYALRDAVNPENLHFELTLASDTVSGFTPVVRNAIPGDEIVFEELNAGTYKLSCRAWDDVSKKSFYAWTVVDVSVGEESEAVINNWLGSVSEHVKLISTDEGVEITLSGFTETDLSDITSLTIYDSVSDDDVRCSDFCFEFNAESYSSMFENGSYTFLWPFAPVKVNGQSRDIYKFKLEYMTSSGSVRNKEDVVCFYKGSTYTLNLADYNAIQVVYEEPYFDTNHLYVQRYLSLNQNGYNTFANTVKNAVPEDKITQFDAYFKIWSGDYTTWSRSSNSSLVASWNKTFTVGGSPAYDTLSTLLKGSRYDMLASNMLGSTYNAKNINEALAAAGSVTFALNWKFAMSDIPYGSFSLPAITKCCHYTPIPTSMTSDAATADNPAALSVSIDSVGQFSKQIAFSVTVPANTVYMILTEGNTHRSYVFTGKDASGNILTTMNETKVPWAFCGSTIDSNAYHMYILDYTYSPSNGVYNSGKKFVYLYGINSPGEDVGFPEFSSGWSNSAPQVIINTDDFKVKLPSEPVSYYSTCSMSGSTYSVESKFMVYNLSFSNGNSYDLRFSFAENPPAGLISFVPYEAAFTLDGMQQTPYDVKASELIYWCNNNEDGGKCGYSTLYSAEGGGANLAGSPSLSTSGYIGFRMKNGSNYLDSGSTTIRGEYRCGIWSSGTLYSGPYPEP